MSPQASGHAMAFCTGTTALPIPSHLVFIILDRLSMCLVKKHLTMQHYLINSTHISQDGETVGMKARTRIGNKAPDSSALQVALQAESTLGRDGSLLVILENEKPGPVIVGSGITKLETTL